MAGFVPSSGGRSDRISAPRDPVELVLWSTAAILVALAVILRPSRLLPTAASTADPFVTLGAVIGAAALLDRWGLFLRLADALVPGTAGPRSAFARVLILTALLSGFVNLDVAVTVAMPVALRIVRRTGASAGSLALAVAATANASSILLPTSNVTNLLVIDRTPLGVLAYARDSWLPWLFVVALAVAALTLALGHPRAEEPVPGGASSALSLRPALDLVPMFLAATGIRALLSGGFTLPGSFAEQVGLGSLLAAGLNNLPAAAGIHVASAPAAWPAVLAMAIGPNLLLTGSVATVICRRMAREAGTDLDPVRFSLVGLALTPLLLGAAFLGLRVTGVT